mmetsp:Transcript_51763/g.59464  ORF Transcript_51763/g.59464 Transcript_51763/m.59464 type:complete len:399 (-) Transcript_51763:23-1219(-)
MVEKKLFDLAKLIKFRKHMHNNPELAFEEVNTSKNIISYLKDLGIEDSQIRVVAKTGLVVDIKGKGAPSGKPYTVAFRADMDCLPMKELNDVEYKSNRDDRAHMCGHDGHCTWMLGATSKLMEVITQIPSDKVARLLFQPAEESPGGAFPMIQEGCLDGVDEVYGAHNLPVQRTGKLLVKSGPVMSQVTIILINIIGKGGHGSAPEKAKDPLQAAVDIHLGYRELLKNYDEHIKKKTLVSTMPFLQCGEAPNVIHERAVLKGTIRSFDETLTLKFKAEFQAMCEQVCRKHGVKLDMQLNTLYPATVNTPKETQIVKDVAKEIYGEDNVSEENLPLMASEDFSFFTRYVPGVFFFPTSGRLNENNPYLHEPNFNFDDEAIEKASELFYKLALHRFDVKL